MRRKGVPVREAVKPLLFVPVLRDRLLGDKNSDFFTTLENLEKLCKHHPRLVTIVEGDFIELVTVPGVSECGKMLSARDANRREKRHEIDPLVSIREHKKSQTSCRFVFLAKESETGIIKIPTLSRQSPKKPV